MRTSAHFICILELLCADFDYLSHINALDYVTVGSCQIQPRFGANEPCFPRPLHTNTVCHCCVIPSVRRTYDNFKYRPGEKDSTGHPADEKC